MFTSADAVHHLTTEPTQEALHREEYFHTRGESDAANNDEDIDHRAVTRARLLRAQVIARVGSFFA